MGAQLTSAVWTRWPGLSHSAKLVLLRMAQTAKDTDQEPVYWAGWELLAHALGETSIPERPECPSGVDLEQFRSWPQTQEVVRERRRIQRKVDRAVGELITARALTRVAEPRPGRSATYRLEL